MKTKPCFYCGGHKTAQSGSTPPTTCHVCGGIGFDVAGQDDLVCPECGYIEEDSWELPDDEDSFECRDCGLKFSYESYTQKTFTSKKTPCANDQAPHDWVDMAGSFTGLYESAKRCRVCDAREYGKAKPKKPVSL